VRRELTTATAAICLSVLSAPPAHATPAAAKLRGGLAELAAGVSRPDPLVGRLTPGYRSGELVYFAVLRGPATAERAFELERLHAHVVRTYPDLEAFELRSTRRVLGRVAGQPWVRWLAPVERVEATDELPVDQTRATTADVGAPQWWASGVTGAGVRVAVLDTGLDSTHPDLDDLDFGHWSSPLNPPKVVDSKNFVGGVTCGIPGTLDGHGHGTHVAGIAVGTGAGTPLADDNGRYAGIAPGAQLAVAKVLTDAGAGVNADLIAAMEWAARPQGAAPCGVGADIVNLSLGSEARPTRLNSGDDVDMVSYALNHLAVGYGTLFVAAAGNSGPFIGSLLEAPGAAAQALSVAAAAKLWDVNHDDTLAGDTCAGWQHPPSPSLADNDCSAGVGTQPQSLASFSSRGPSGDLWLRPDLSAPGYDIVSAQAAAGTALAGNDLNIGTRTDPLYATASGTSMAAPAAAGSASLVLDAYRQRYGVDPSGTTGLAGLAAPRYALLRAALMNSAAANLYEARWILTTGAAMQVPCGLPDPILMTFCELGQAVVDAFASGFGSFTLSEARNAWDDPYVGPLGEGAGKLDISGAVAALRDGVVAYSTASGSGAEAGTGARDLQGSWQVGAMAAGTSESQRFVLNAAPGLSSATATFSFQPGNPSDGSRAIVPGKGSWTVKLPGKTTVRGNKDALVTFTLVVPASATPGSYTGAVVVQISTGQILRIPVFVGVALHDSSVAAGTIAGPQSKVTSALDVYGKADTTWPSAAGTSGTGAGSDWLLYPVELASGLSEARFAIYDAAAGDETYDLYLYDSDLELVASTHPFAAPGITDPVANAERPPSTQAAPQVLTASSPSPGRHYLAVSRAKIGGTSTGDFGSFVLSLDETR
jgi:subtilisin family serine protease